MSYLTQSFTRLDEAQLASLILSAQERLAYLAPGISDPLALLLIERGRVLGSEAVRIVIDLDPEALRLGYGTLGGLQCLQNGADRYGLSLACQPGLQIGLLIVDHNAVVFTPAAQMVETGGNQGFQPNAIFLEEVPESVLNELGWGAPSDPVQLIGTHIVSAENILDVAQDIADNPPQRFDIARTVRVFNSRFEFVELKIKGTAIERIEINLPVELLGLAQNPDVERHLHARYHLQDANSDISSEQIRTARRRLIDCHLIGLPGYGQVVLRRDKEKLLQGIELLKEELQKFSDDMRSRLQTEIDRNCEALFNAIIPAVLSKPPHDWLKQFMLFDQEESIQTTLHTKLQSAFGTADRWIQRMSVTVVFKGVTYEMLKDPKFIEIAKAAFPGLLHEEFDAALAFENTC